MRSVENSVVSSVHVGGGGHHRADAGERPKGGKIDCFLTFAI